MNKIFWKILIFKESCERLFKWFPILYRDRDWDQNFLFEIIQFKMKCMRDHLDKFGDEVWVSRQRKIKQLKTCEMLLERLMNNNYCEFEYDEINKKYGKVRLGRKGMYRAKALREKDKKEELKEFRRLMRKEKLMYKQDMDLFCKIFSKHSGGWWT